MESVKIFTFGQVFVLEEIVHLIKTYPTRCLVN